MVFIQITQKNTKLRNSELEQQMDTESELEATLQELGNKGVRFDVSDSQALKGLLKAYKGNKEIYLLLLEAKKQYTRVQRTSEATKVSNYKRREQLDEVQIIIDDWNNPPTAGGHL